MPKASFPKFIEPQFAKLVDAPPLSDNWVHEIKLDGYRLQLQVVNGRVRLLTRRGHDWTGSFTAIADAAAKLPDCIADGEAVVLDNKGVISFSELQAAIAEGDSERMRFYVFDLMRLKGKDLREESLLARK